MTNLQLTKKEKECLNDLFDFIIIKNLEIDNEDKIKNALDLWIKSKTEFYSKMINKNNSTTDLFDIIADKMFDNYFSQK